MSLKRRSLRLVGFAALAALIAGEPALADPITYNVDQHIGSGKVEGTITTDGTLGVLAKANITDWTLDLTSGADTFTLNLGNSQVLLQGLDLTATPTELLFNFNGTDGGYFAFQANNPGLFSGYHYVCFDTNNFPCAPGAAVVPQNYTDPSAQFEPRTGTQAIASTHGGGGGSVDAIARSILELANSRSAQMLISQLQSMLLLGLNEQVSCGDCGGVGMGFGSFALSGHGRHALTDELTLMGGVDVGQYEQKDADVNLNAGFAAALQYDPANFGRSRPYAEVGVSAALQNTRYRRSYDAGAGVATGVGKARNYDVAVYGEVGWVDRLTPKDEAAIYASYARTWQIVGGYAEKSGIGNPLGAAVPGGTDVMDSAGLHVQYTHLFGRRVEAGLNGGVDWAFNMKSGLNAQIGGGSFAVAPTSFVSYEAGGRVGIRVTPRMTVDLFVNGVIAPDDIGSSVHGGFGARWSF